MHLLSPTFGLSKLQDVIKRRFPHGDLELSSGTKVFQFPKTEATAVIKAIYSNDEEYRNMFGLSAAGLYPLNEALYMASKYGYIRAAHISLLSELTLTSSIMETTLNIEETRSFTYSFLDKYGDYEVWSYYLHPNSGVKLPKFGVGQYQHS
jgi:hypothetical protein